VVGLGAQAPALGATLTIKPGTVRYLKAIAQRSHTIGVRGEFTAEVLARIGIRNTVVIGCPSHFINPSPTLGKTIERKLRQFPFQHFSVTAGDLDPAHQHLERKLFSWLLQRQGFYVCQSTHDLLALARQRLNELNHEQMTHIAQYLQQSAPDLPSFLHIARDRFRAFFDAPEWIAAMTSMNLVAGPRFHGNQLALQAGTPAVCIYHDSRTEELSKTLLLPQLSVADAFSATSPEDLSARAVFDADRYDSRRLELAAIYCRLFAQSGITLSHSLRSLVGNP
jgi:polysaccharide pyruvyl transferase WcaK-like protein